MASVKPITEKEYLMEVFSELEAIKTRITMLRADLAAVYGTGGKQYLDHDRHLLELADYIDWKLQVLEKGTAFDWKAAGTNVESDVSVHAPEIAGRPDFSGGYLGG